MTFECTTISRVRERDGVPSKCRPTGCRLAAASAGNACQNATDLVREAVGYSGVFGRSRMDSIHIVRDCLIWNLEQALRDTIVEHVEQMRCTGSHSRMLSWGG